MKKNILLVLAAFCLFAAPLSALEWGGLVNNETKFSKTVDSAFHQANSIFLWVNTPVTGDLAFSAEGTYKFAFDKMGDTKTPSSMLDLDLLKLGGNIKAGPGTLVLNAGRFMFSDLTGANFAQCSDGVALNYNIPAVHVGAYVGYTGLLNSLNVSMLLSDQDTPSDKKVYAMAHPYLPLMVSFELPSILGNQALAVQWESVLDMGKAKYNRNYANLSMSGPIAGTIFYQFVTSLGMIDKDLMNYTNVSVAAYPTSEIGITGGVEFASGNMGALKPYRTVTSKTAYNSALAPEMSGCIVPCVDFIYTIGSMFVDLNAKLPFDMPEKKAAFKGFGADVTFIYNIFSDLQAEADVSYFKDKATSGADDNFAATLKFAISF